MGRAARQPVYHTWLVLLPGDSERLLGLLIRPNERVQEVMQQVISNAAGYNDEIPVIAGHSRTPCRVIPLGYIERCTRTGQQWISVRRGGEALLSAPRPYLPARAYLSGAAGEITSNVAGYDETHCGQTSTRATGQPILTYIERAAAHDVYQATRAEVLTPTAGKPNPALVLLQPAAMLPGPDGQDCGECSPAGLRGTYQAIASNPGSSGQWSGVGNVQQSRGSNWSYPALLPTNGIADLQLTTNH